MSQYINPNLKKGLETTHFYPAEGASVYHSLDQSVADSTPITLTWDSEAYDTNDIHSSVTNPSRLTAQTAGKYLVWATVVWEANGSGDRNIEIKKNGQTTSPSVQYFDVSGKATVMSMNISGILDLIVNDYIELEVYQTSGEPLNVLNGVSGFGMQRIG